MRLAKGSIAVRPNSPTPLVLRALIPEVPNRSIGWGVVSVSDVRRLVGRVVSDLVHLLDECRSSEQVLQRRLVRQGFDAFPDGEGNFSEAGFKHFQGHFAGFLPRKFEKPSGQSPIGHQGVVGLGLDDRRSGWNALSGTPAES